MRRGSSSPPPSSSVARPSAASFWRWAQSEKRATASIDSAHVGVDRRRSSSSTVPRPAAASAAATCASRSSRWRDDRRDRGRPGRRSGGRARGAIGAIGGSSTTQPVQAGQVRGHVGVGRTDDDRRAVHHVVAREQQPFAPRGASTGGPRRGRGCATPGARSPGPSSDEARRRPRGRARPRPRGRRRRLGPRCARPGPGAPGAWSGWWWVTSDPADGGAPGRRRALDRVEVVRR